MNEQTKVGDKIFIGGMPVYSFWQKVWSLIRWRYWPTNRNGEFVITSITTATKLDE